MLQGFALGSVAASARAGLASLLLAALIVACGPPTMPTSPVGPQAGVATPLVAESATPERLADKGPTPQPTVTLTVGLTMIPDRLSEASASPTLAPSPMTGSQPEASPEPTATVQPESPEPPGVCPALSEEAPAIVTLGPETGIIAGFQPQILAYLNAGGDPNDLREMLAGLTLVDKDGTEWLPRAQVILADVTGDGTPEVVVALTFYVEGQYAEGGLFVYGCQSGAYVGDAVVPLGGQVPGAAGPDPGIRAIQDMNGDGVAEIVLSYIEVVGTHANFTRQFRILEWDGARFLDLVQSEGEPAYAAPVLNGDGTIYDTNGNKNLELVLRNGVGRGYEDGGPQRERTDTWAWNGQVFHLLRSEYAPPVYRFQAVQDGDDAARAGRLERALALYDRVINDEGLLGWNPGQLWPDAAYGGQPTPLPDPEERERLAAYALYRTMLVYARQGDKAQAQSALERLQAGHPEGSVGWAYARLAAAFWEGYNGGDDVAAGCKRAVQFAAAESEAVLAPLGSGVYGANNRDYSAPDICPYGEE